MPKTLLLLAALAVARPVLGSGSLPPERDVVAALLAGGVAGETVWLENAEGRFLALYLESRSANPHGAVLIVHDLAGNASSPRVVAPVRLALPEHGWHTLSLQMPRPRSSVPADSIREFTRLGEARIRAGLEYLESREQTVRVILAYGLGAAPVSRLLGRGSAPRIAAYVAVSPVFGPAPAPVPAPAPGEGEPLDVPSLEIRGGNEPAGRGAAAAGRAPGRTPAVRRMEITGATRAYRGHTEVLVKRIRGWLREVASRGVAAAGE